MCVLVFFYTVNHEKLKLVFSFDFISYIMSMFPKRVSCKNSNGKIAYLTKIAKITTLLEIAIHVSTNKLLITSVTTFQRRLTGLYFNSIPKFLIRL